MRRDANGAFKSRKTARGTAWGVRAKTADGQRIYVTVGKSWEGDTEREARAAAERVTAQAKLGTYQTEAERRTEREERERARDEVPHLAPFAREWLDRRVARREVPPKVQARLDAAETSEERARLRRHLLDGDATNQVEQHLLPWFGAARLDEIDVREVETYLAAKVAASRDEGGLSATYANRTVQTLAAILRVAVRHGVIDRNPADLAERLKGTRFEGTGLDRAVHVHALLDAAATLDGERRGRRGHGRALLATMTFAGLRIGEALDLTWNDVDLAGGSIRVRGTKTPAARRNVDLLPALRDELAELKIRRPDDPRALVFGTARGATDSRSNVRRRVLAPALALANERLTMAGEDPLPAITPHSLRRTFISIVIAIGWDIRIVMRQVGHTDPGLTLRTYAHAVGGGETARNALRALVEGREITDTPDASLNAREAS